ncbi:hypothetical protein MRB53_013564 [Persea americana]|uniref:Uncharacterized protein n=1 Tax=Persea americana TaxID=3435 RepID=A0ACC2K8B4_PERAE|nr:hypothetical protein MRB53_013564 [Persea americana]
MFDYLADLDKTMPENDEVPLLCNYGGNFIYRSGIIVYEGGTRRLIFVSRSVKLSELLVKVNEICIPTLIPSIKYGYPGLSLDASLTSILNDDDVSNMMKVFPQSGATPIQLYAIPLQSPSNSISIPVTATCQKQGLATGAIQETQRVVHQNSETFTSSSQMVDAYSKDGNQNVLSHLHEDACINMDNPLQDIDNGSIQTIVGGLHKRHETATSSPSVIDAYSSDDFVSSSVEWHEEGCTMVDNTSYKDKLKISYTLSQGQEFRDANALDMALREHAIQLHFEYRPIRTDPSRIVVGCYRKGCPWRINASKVPYGPTFVIDVLEKEHTCKCTVQDCKNHRQASMNWIANFIIRNRKHLRSRPMDIKQDIALQYEIEVEYDKARRGKGLASEEKHLGDSISDISAYCDEIERTNPGSLANLGFSLDGSFGVFIAYHAAICGFQLACRPIIILNGRSFEGEFPHIWILASSRDANNEEFLLAYAITESRTKETWTWFCVQLAFILKDTSKITVVTERHEKSSEAVGRIFPKAHHRYCRESLYSDFCQRFECENLRKHFSDAIFAVTVCELDKYLTEISSTSPEAHQWISEISPSRKDWAVSHFDVDGQDYTDRACEKVLDIWTDDKDAMKSSSVISSLERFHTEIRKIFYRRIKKGKEFTTPVTPYATRRIDEEMIFCILHDMQHVNTPTQFDVRHIFESTTHMVDIKQRKCSCHLWELQKFPCSHAVAALYRNDFNVSDYCECYTVAKYQEAYSENIYPTVEHIPPMLHKNSKKRGRML